MELLTVKILVLSLSGVIRLIFGLVPIFFVRYLSKRWGKVGDRRMKVVIGLLMYFGGGVLLATCFLHMMPEVRQSFAKGAPNIDIPIGEIVFIIGFFFVYLLEDVVHSCLHKRRKGKESSATSSTSSPGSIRTISAAESVEKISERQNKASVAESRLARPEFSLGPGPLPHHQNGHHGSEGAEGNGGEKFSYIDPDWWRDTVIANSQMNLLSNSTFSVSSLNHPLHLQHKMYSGEKNPQHLNNIPPLRTGNNNNKNNANNTNMNNINFRPPTLELKKEEGHGGHGGHSHIHMESDEDFAGSLRNLLIVVAISFHAVFEGMAIGLQGTEKDVWYLFLAVSLHECTILFCIGIELISSRTRLAKMITYISVVSLVNPIGIAVGILISENSFRSMTLHALIIGSFQGLAAGTLLYVSLFEIFAEEGKKLKRKFFHILVAILGFILMGSIEFIGGHSHGPKSERHDDHGGHHNHEKGEHDHDEGDHDHHHHHH